MNVYNIIINLKNPEIQKKKKKEKKNCHTIFSTQSKSAYEKSERESNPIPYPK